MDTEEGRRSKRDIIPHVENLVDLVFGLALSIGSLILITNPPQNSHDLLEDVIAFAYGFIILVFIWEEFSQTMMVVKVETKGMLRTTYIMLFLVAIEPYLFNLITSPQQTGPNVEMIDSLASMIYALDLAGLMLALAFFSDHITKQNNLEHSSLRAIYRSKRDSFLLSATIFLFSTLPFFWDSTLLDLKLRYWLWILAPILPRLYILVVKGGSLKRKV